MSARTIIPTDVEEDILEMIRQSKSFQFLCKAIDPSDENYLGNITLELKYSSPEPESRIIHTAKGDITREVEGNLLGRKDTKPRGFIELEEDVTSEGNREYYRRI